MPNGQEMLDDMEFERSLIKMSDRELAEFTARQVYDIKIDVSSNTKRIITLENKDKKIYGLAGLIGSFVGAAIVVLIEHFA